LSLFPVIDRLNASSSRCPSPLAVALDAFAEKSGITRSEAVRQLIERGLAKGRGGSRS